MTIEIDQLAHILEAAMLVSNKPMTLAQFESLFGDELEKPTRDALREALAQLQSNYETRGIELVEVASGYRLQAKQSYTPWLTHLYQEKAPRYSRALLETLVLIAYRQPITRGEIEDVRGVAVSSNIVKTLIERNWVRILGHRDVPGRPALLGTTREFLDYFNLKRIDELPTLSEIKDLAEIDPELAKEMALLEPDSNELDLATQETAEESAADANSDATAETAEELSEVTEEHAQASVERQEAISDELDASMAMNETLVPDVDLDLGEEENAQLQAQATPDNARMPQEDQGIDSEDPLSLTANGVDDNEFADSTQHETRIAESETLH